MKMHDTAKRFGVSMEPALLRQLDDFVRQKGYQNRSHAIRILVKEAMLDQLKQKKIIHFTLNITQAQLAERFAQIVQRCNQWGKIHCVTTVFPSPQIVTIQLVLEIAESTVAALLKDPLLQPIQFIKGVETNEANV